MVHAQGLDYKKILIFFVLALFITMVEFLFIFYKQINNNAVNVTVLSCEVAGGVWVGGYNECEYAPMDWCNRNGGIFQECASASRHNSEAEIFTKNCIPVCVLDISSKFSIGVTEM